MTIKVTVGGGGDKGTVGLIAQTVLACLPGDSRLSVVELCACSLTRTCPKWGRILLYTWGATTVFPDITGARTE